MDAVTRTGERTWISRASIATENDRPQWIAAILALILTAALTTAFVAILCGNFERGATTRGYCRTAPGKPVPNSTRRRSVLGFIQVTTVDLHPGLDVLGQPHLALGQIRDGLGKVRTAGDLVRPLTAHTAQADTDLVCAHEADRLHSHMIDRRRGTIRHTAGWRETASRTSIRIVAMTRCRSTSGHVPVSPRHRRDWRTLWRRCRCGLPAPCVDRLVPAPPRPYPPRGEAPERSTPPAHSDKVPPDPRKPRLAAVPRQRQASTAHNARPHDSPGPAIPHSPGSASPHSPGSASPHSPGSALRHSRGSASTHGLESGTSARCGGEPDGSTSARDGNEPGSDAEKEARPGLDSIRAGTPDERSVGRASVPRPRHAEANVGRAGNLTPGQRQRTVCNDPFKNHLHRRRDRR